MCCQPKHCEDSCRLVNVSDRAKDIFLYIIYLRILVSILLFLIGPSVRLMENTADFYSFTASLTYFKVLYDFIFILFCIGQFNMVIFNNKIIAAYYKIIAWGSVLTILISVIIFCVILNTSPLTYNMLTIGGGIGIALCVIDQILIGLMFYFKEQTNLPDDQYNELSDHIV
jgi:hypothetical protein